MLVMVKFCLRLFCQKFRHIEYLRLSTEVRDTAIQLWFSELLLLNPADWSLWQ